MLVHRDEDAKSEASTNKDKDRESISIISSIFQSIKCSEDIVDAAKSKVGDIIYLSSFLCCDSVIDSHNSSKQKEKERNCRIVQRNAELLAYLYYHLKFSEFTCYL